MPGDREWARWLADSLSRLMINSAEFANIVGTTKNAVHDWRSIGLEKSPRRAYIDGVVAKLMETSDIPQDIPAWISENMHRLGLSGVDLANAIGVSQQAVSQWMLGQKRPSRRNIDELRAAFDDLGSSVLRPPIQFERIDDCAHCEMYALCSGRVANDLSMCCEGFTERELALFDFNGQRTEMVWWENQSSSTS